jgi:hypothetical protein
MPPPPRRGHRPESPHEGRKALSSAGDITPSTGPIKPEEKSLDAVPRLERL